MDSPETTLDPRFSSPDVEPTTWSAASDVLDGAQLSWISTVRGDGRPHVTPLVAVWLDGFAYFSTGPEEQKAINLETNSSVALTTGCNRWDDGLDVVVEGSAERVTDPPLLERLAALWAEKWDGRWQFEPRDGMFHHVGGPANVFRIVPTKVLAFGRPDFTQTRHVFR